MIRANPRPGPHYRVPPPRGALLQGSRVYKCRGLASQGPGAGGHVTARERTRYCGSESVANTPRARILVTLPHARSTPALRPLYAPTYRFSFIHLNELGEPLPIFFSSCPPALLHLLNPLPARLSRFGSKLYTHLHTRTWAYTTEWPPFCMCRFTSAAPRTRHGRVSGSVMKRAP